MLKRKKKNVELDADTKKINALCQTDKKFKKLWLLSRWKLYLTFFKRKCGFYVSKIAWSVLASLIPLFAITQWTGVTNQVLYMPQGISSRYVVLNEHMSYFWAIVSGACIILAGLLIFFKINWNYRKHLVKYDLNQNLINWRTYKKTEYPKLKKGLLIEYAKQKQKNK